MDKGGRGALKVIGANETVADGLCYIREDSADSDNDVTLSSSQKSKQRCEVKVSVKSMGDYIP